MPEAGWAGEQWEYATMAGEEQDQALLDRMGAEGWELVAVLRQAGSRAVFIFKRRRRHGVERITTAGD